MGLLLFALAVAAGVFIPVALARRGWFCRRGIHRWSGWIGDGCGFDSATCVVRNE